VPLFQFSRRAEADLLAIGAYTLRTWGKDQVVHYIDGLEACCRMLAENPALGRTCDDIRPGLRRMEHGRHVVFYRQAARCIVVSRILHQRVLPGRQSVGDEDDWP
jgi:toxin ParE1/3/4